MRKLGKILFGAITAVMIGGTGLYANSNICQAAKVDTLWVNYTAKRPADNRTYTEEEVSYDSFGNELTYRDENGLVSKTSYDTDSGEETETINAVGTEYESKDTEGNAVSQTSTAIRGKNRVETVTTYETDDFGRTTQENTVTRKQQDGNWFPAYETQTLSTYDDDGNVSQTETKSRKEGESDWQIQIVKTDYDEQGQVTGEYTPRGTKQNVATKYEYNFLGQMIQSEIPQEKKDGSISCQKTTTEYDNTGNVTEQENCKKYR